MTSSSLKITSALTKPPTSTVTVWALALLEVESFHFQITDYSLSPSLTAAPFPTAGLCGYPHCTCSPSSAPLICGCLYLSPHHPLSPSLPSSFIMFRVHVSNNLGQAHILIRCHFFLSYLAKSQRCMDPTICYHACSQAASGKVTQQRISVLHQFMTTMSRGALTPPGKP